MVTSEIDLPDTWAYGAGVLHGGWLLETLVTQALAHTGHPHPLAVSAHYPAAPRVGRAQLEVEVLREGRSVSTLRARLSQHGHVKVEALVTCGSLPARGQEPVLLDAHPPVLPAPEVCLHHVAPPGVARNGVTEQLEVRLDPATASWATADFGHSAQVRAWVRAVNGRPADPLMLMTVADALPPVTLDLGIPGWVPTLQLTVLLRSLPAPGWLRCLQRARLVHGGWFDEECEIWDATGALVAQARQLAAYRPTP